MRNLVLCVPFLLAASAASAQDVPNSLNMTCAAAQTMVRERGEAVIGTGPVAYSRYVSDGKYCSSMQTVKPAWLQTSDQAECPVGYFCVEQHSNH
ncbi:hypothetical protein [Ancylobacter lacus]|uniref:hypothetical protein n=1 Tax=Ancylobacter lacus TaxID=2579970 RepID=UPI001BD16A70|nr:hypothetical protein [Ancylobacter lacus]MBS7540441.1 hypothetical protein [Ancylobacter lacus]